MTELVDTLFDVLEAHGKQEIAANILKKVTQTESVDVKTYNIYKQDIEVDYEESNLAKMYKPEQL